MLQTSLDDFYVSYQFNAYTRDANVMAATYSALRDGSAASIPPEPHGKPTGAPRPFAVRVEPVAGS